MRKNKIGIVLLCFVALFTFGVFAMSKINPRTIAADSGWDSDYGGSDWGGSDSSWDSDYGGSSGGSSGGDFFATLIVFFVIFIIVVIICLIPSKKNQNSISFENKDDLIPKFFPNYSIDQFKDKLYQIFIDVQNAWMEFDYEQLNKLCTEELYQSYRSDLEVLKLKHGKNIMSNFDLINYGIKNIFEQNEMIIVQFQLQVTFHDYVIDTNTNEVIRGNKNTFMNNTYSLEYVVKKNKNHELEKCPNCGSVLKGRDCEYCNSHFELDDYEIVLSKKSKIG